MNILLIEDQVLIRELLVIACRQALPDYRLHWSAGVAEGLQLCARMQPALVFLDIVLPDGDGIAAVPEIRRLAAAAKIIGLSSHVDEFTIFRAQQAELDGFIDKNEQTLDMLRQAVAGALEGRPFFSATAQRVWSALRADPTAFSKVLSPREIEVLRLVGTGADNAEIAERLSLSESTVRNHRQNIMVKLDLRSTPLLMRYALEKGFTRFGVGGVKATS